MHGQGVRFCTWKGQEVCLLINVKAHERDLIFSVLQLQLLEKSRP